MKRSILALAAGAFILGAAEFVMMGILPQTAAAMQVSIPAAGHYISAYAIGVCVGTLILVFGRKVPPKNLIILFMIIALVGNTLSAVSFNSPMLLAARFISGLPHGAFFGTATLVAKTLADKGQGSAVRVDDGDGSDGCQYVGCACGHIAFGNAVVAFGVRDSCRLGVDDDGAGDCVGAVRRAD